MDGNRRASRVETSIDIYWGFTEDCPYPGTIINLTALGCAIHNTQGIEVRAKQLVFIRFWMPHERILKIEIVHQSLKNAQGFGAKFLDLSEQEKETLEQIVQLFGEPKGAGRPKS